MADKPIDAATLNRLWQDITASPGEPIKYAIVPGMGVVRTDSAEWRAYVAAIVAKAGAGRSDPPFSHQSEEVCNFSEP